MSLAFKGRILSEEQKLKRSISLKKYWQNNPQARIKLSKISLGRKLSEETKQKLSKSHIGEKNYNWKGGITPLRTIIWRSDEYQLWRIAIFTRDDFTCQECGERGGRLEADHIKPWALFPELRFAIDNGRTLCQSCHRMTETFGGRIIYRKVGVIN